MNGTVTDPGLPKVITLLPLYFALFFLLTCINALFAKFMVFSFPIAPGVSSLYLVVCFMILFALWFGLWGSLAAYAGCFIGAGILGGIPFDVSLLWSFADFLEAFIPLLAFRILKADPSLISWRDVSILFIFGIVLNNCIGAAWGSVTLAISGLITWNELSSTFFGWLTGNLIVCLILIPPLLHLVTPRLSKHKLYIKNYLR